MCPMSGYNTNLASEFHVLSVLHRLGTDATLSFVSKSDFHHGLKLEIIKDGRVIGESDTDAPYGVVGVARDVN